MKKLVTLSKINLLAFALIAGLSASVVEEAQADGHCKGQGNTCQILQNGEWIDFKNNPLAP